ncbi:MAG TPA: hypothetical protein VGE66_19930 [Chitinophagaceae bacterium]
MSEESFTIYLKDFQILYTDADGGHRYISTSIDYNGGRRALTAFFADREDEERIDETIPVILKGNLLAEDGEHTLLLMNASIVIEEPRE